MLILVRLAITLAPEHIHVIGVLGSDSSASTLLFHKPNCHWSHLFTVTPDIPLSSLVFLNHHEVSRFLPNFFEPTPFFSILLSRVR